MDFERRLWPITVSAWSANNDVHKMLRTHMRERAVTKRGEQEKLLTLR